MLVSNQGEIHQMAPHPFYPSVAVTAGEDGMINMWDLDCRESYFRAKLTAPGGLENIAEGSAVACCDVNFSPDGTRLVVSDFLGRIYMYGVDAPERFKTARKANLLAMPCCKAERRCVVARGDGAAAPWIGRVQKPRNAFTRLT